MQKATLYFLCLSVVLLIGGVLVQYRIIYILNSDIHSLQAKNQELATAVEFSQLITDDLRSELLFSNRQPNTISNVNASITGQCQKADEYSSLDLFLLEAQKSFGLDDSRVKAQARLAVDTLYSDFINERLGRDAERRMIVRDILRDMEQQRIELFLDYIYGRTDAPIDTKRLSRAEYNANIDQELTKILSGEEVAALDEYRLNGFPIATRRDIKNRIDKYAKGLTDENKALLTEELTSIKLLDLTSMDFNESLNKQIAATEALLNQISRMEKGQSLIAQRFYFNYTRNLQQLTHTLLTERMTDKNKE